MRAPADNADRRRQDLAELAELGMALARKVQAQAMAAPDDEVADLALAFQRISRSVRQTHALAARLERDARTVHRETEVAARRETLARVQRRRAQVRNALSPLIWTEAEGDEDEAEALFETLDARLMDDDLLTDDFAAAPLDACIAAIRADLGLPAAEANDHVPDVVVWRSSA